MYVTQTDACTMPNGLIPASAAQVSAARTQLASAEASIQRAQSVFNGLLQRRDMGPVPRSLSPSDVAALRQWPSVKFGTGKTANVTCYPASVNTAPLDTMPAAPPMPPLTTAHGVDQPLTPPTTGNPCLDVEMGYALQSQLSPAMLWKCTSKGYFKPGVKPTVASVLALANSPGGLPKLADSDVPDFDPSMTLGLGDTAPGQSFVLWASVGLLGATLWLAHEWSKAGR